MNINLKQSNLSYFILRWLLTSSEFLSSMRINAQVLPNRVLSLPRHLEGAEIHGMFNCLFSREYIALGARSLSLRWEGK